MKTTEVNANGNGQKGKSHQRFSVLTAMIIVITLIFADESFAQRRMKGNGSAGWGMGSQYSRMYDPKTVETIVGEVVSVDKITPVKGMSNGVHLIVKTAKETISVHLGPEWYMVNQKINLEPKDKVEVKGSRIIFDGKPAIIASEVKKGSATLKLRDENGIPVWSGWRQH